MQKNDLMRLHHMLDAVKEAVSFAQNKTRIDLNTDRKLALALVKSIEIMGSIITTGSRKRLTKSPDRIKIDFSPWLL